MSTRSMTVTSMSCGGCIFQRLGKLSDWCQIMPVDVNKDGCFYDIRENIRFNTFHPDCPMVEKKDGE